MSAVDGVSGVNGRSDRPELNVLVVAKAPVAGQAKTRLAATVGDVAAADLAACALLDTLAAAETVTSPDRRLIALTGDLDEAERSQEIRKRLESWQVIGQRGATFAARLVNAHHDAATLWGADTLVVQIGMDTPQVTLEDLTALAAAALHPTGAEAVGEPVAGGGAPGCALGPAVDGGWWGVATTRSGYMAGVSDVPMSRPDTGVLTARALRTAGARVELVHELRDVDTLDDAAAVARDCPELAFSRLFQELYGDSGPDRAEDRSRDPLAELPDRQDLDVVAP